MCPPTPVVVPSRGTTLMITPTSSLGCKQRIARRPAARQRSAAGGQRRALDAGIEAGLRGRVEEHVDHAGLQVVGAGGGHRLAHDLREQADEQRQDRHNAQQGHAALRAASATSPAALTDT